MKIFFPVDSLQDTVYPVDLRIDISLLKSSVNELFKVVGRSEEQILQEVRANGFSTINLTHLPGLSGAEKWFKFRGNHRSVKLANVDERDFSEVAAELQGTYLGKVINSVFDYHKTTTGKIFQGRCQLIWIGPGRCYGFHVDKHTPDRYHIPIITDPNCWFLFKNEQLTPVHLPADGRVWYLNPLNTEHTVVHCGGIPRLHLLLTNGHHAD